MYLLAFETFFPLPLRSLQSAFALVAAASWESRDATSTVGLFVRRERRGSPVVLSALSLSGLSELA